MDRAGTLEFDAAKVDACCARLDRCHQPGAVVGIAINGRPVYRKGFGLANLELPVVLTPSTRLRICSVTKQFTALAYLLLCEEGRARLDDRIGQYLPEIHAANRGVTARQLLGNISGLRDVHGICWQMSGLEAKASSDDLLRLYRAISDVSFAPGTAYCYNNGGFLLLSAAIERIANESLEEVFRRRIFEPLGMSNSRLQRSDSCFVPGSAASHVNRADGNFYKVMVGSETAGEGGIVSTVDDMLRWLANMGAPTVGSAGSWRQLQEPQQLLNGSATGYGMGLAVGSYRGIQMLSHPGGWMGTNAQLLKVPAAGLDIIVIANRHDVASTVLASEILDVCLPHLDPVEASISAPLAQGVYRAERTGRVIELKVQDTKQVVSIDGMDVAVRRDADGTLRPTGLMGFMKQSFTLKGNACSPSAVIFNDFGNVEQCFAAPAPARSQDSILGRYVCESAPGAIEVMSSSDGLSVKTSCPSGSVRYRPKAVAERIWRLIPESDAAQWGGTLSLAEDGHKLYLSSWSNWALPFRRDC